MEKNSTAKLLAVVNIIAFVGTISVNGLANALPLNGLNTGEISNMFPNLFAPPGYVFSIWAVIYLFLLFFIIYQSRVLFGGGKRAREIVLRIGWKFAIASAANMGWIFLWHYLLIPYSLLMMLLLLGTLIGIYLSLNRGEPVVPPMEAPGTEIVSVYLPFSIYLGWISVATIANVAVVLLDAGWNGGGLSPVVWTIVMIAAATLITVLMLALRQDVFFTLVIVWAFTGIAIKQSAAEPAIVIAAYAAVALLSLWMMLLAVFRFRLR